MKTVEAKFSQIPENALSPDFSEVKVSTETKFKCDHGSLFTVASFIWIMDEHFPPVAGCSRPHIPDIDPIASRRGMVVPAISVGIQDR